MADIFSILPHPDRPFEPAVQAEIAMPTSEVVVRLRAEGGRVDAQVTIDGMCLVGLIQHLAISVGPNTPPKLVLTVWPQRLIVEQDGLADTRVTVLSPDAMPDEPAVHSAFPEA